MLGRLARPWLVGRPCALATNTGSGWPLCRAGGQRSCRGQRSCSCLCWRSALGQTPPRIARGCARTAVLVRPRGRSPLRRPPRRRPPRWGAFLYAPLFLLPAPCNRAVSPASPRRRSCARAADTHTRAPSRRRPRRPGQHARAGHRRAPAPGPPACVRPCPEPACRPCCSAPQGDRAPRNRHAHPTRRRGEHGIGALRTAAASSRAAAPPPHRHLFPSMEIGPSAALAVLKLLLFR